ncbi:MAG: thymidine phosphorylase, partial [Armatimonadetes bacterium]|nr:thymidine phosphorylase [Armatimonadota bacterium]
MDFQDIIAAKREGRANSVEELRFLSQGAADGSLSDEELTAWLKAAYQNTLSATETADLTLAMAESGERLDLAGLPKPWVDKHSTGGVGDKTTIVLLPLLAACGMTVVKMSGRGLGITGGTVDKLGSVPGFRLDLTPEEMKEQAGRIGLAITGQTPRLAPADKKLYALRDVSGTVGSVPLIVSSILSKKIAGGAETVVLDVKCGSGAFMKTLPEAQALAQALVETARLCGLDLHLSITDMDQPLGRAVGNALEVKEAIRVLQGSETGRFRDLCLHFAGRALAAVGKGSEEDARRVLES